MSVHGRAGITLLELLVVLVLLGVVAGIGAVAAARLPERARTSSTAARIAGARRQALRSGTRLTISLLAGGRVLDVTALPNGSVLADSGIGVDRLTGEATR